MKLSEKIKANLWSILLVMSILVFFKQCSVSREQSKISKEIRLIKLGLDSLATREDISKEIKIEGLRTSKRTLYDWNSVVRTTTRPDDRMNQYDQEIESLEKIK